nr:hypothetical protein [Legionella jordanis]
MPPTLIDIRSLKQQKGGGRGKFSHKITKGILPGSSKVWFNKEMKSPDTARLELLAQEFFRLIIPSQPETRIAHHPLYGTFYILSEEVPGYRDLPTNEQDKFTQGIYTLLGFIMIVGVFVQEIDLKNGNIGLNDRDQVIKIDGDWSFVSIKDPDSYGSEPKEITPELLKSLPFPVGFYAFNWLDIRTEEISHSSSRIVDANLANSPHFRQEMNQGMLRILLLPDSYLKKFVDAYIPYGSSADRFYDYLSERREELRKSAMQDQSFKDYLVTQQAKNDAREHLLHMKGFVANGNHAIVKANDYFALDQDFDRLKNLLIPPQMEINEEEIGAIKIIPTADLEQSAYDVTEELEGLEDIAEISFGTTGELTPVEQSPTLVNKTWKGFLGGFLIAAAAVIALMALRVIDVFSFGLSLPLTLAASAGIVITAGVALGVLGGATQYSLGAAQKEQVVAAPEPSASFKETKAPTVSMVNIESNNIVKLFKQKTQKISTITDPGTAEPTQLIPAINPVCEKQLDLKMSH